MKEYLHKQVWNRFIRLPQGIVLDYADENGNVILPTNEDFENSCPNPLGWWTPIENGAFFTGLYTYALLEEYRKSRKNEMAKEINTLIGGLLLLSEVGSVNGFIARGVGEDGKSHYPFSSEDQFMPWVLALHAYANSDLCTDRKKIRTSLLRALLAVRGYGWRIPCDAVGVFNNGWNESSDWRGVSKLLFCAHVLAELTGKSEDEDAFHTLAESAPKNCPYTRLEIVSHGFIHDMLAFLGLKNFWICTAAHLGLRELLEEDKIHADYYRKALAENGYVSLAVIEDLKKYDNSSTKFDTDWRPLRAIWEPTGNDVAAGIAMARKQNAFWTEHCVPHRKAEHQILENALYAAWISLSCEDKKTARIAAKKLYEGLSFIRWDTVHLSIPFVAESALIYAENLS